MGGPREGNVPGMTMKEYHDGPGESSSNLKDALHTLAYYRKRKGATNSKGKHFGIGSGAHGLVFERYPYTENIIEGPENRRGNQWKEFVAERGPNDLVLPEKEYAEAKALADAVCLHPQVAEALAEEDGMAEHSLFADIDLRLWDKREVTLLRKARPDLMTPRLGTIWDLKTAREADLESFRRAAYGYKYHLSAAYYLDVANAVFGAGMFDTFKLIVVEKGENPTPEDVVIYEYDLTALEIGRDQARTAMKKIAEGHLNHIYPGFPSDTQTLSLPAWALNSEDL